MCEPVVCVREREFHQVIKCCDWYADVSSPDVSSPDGSSRTIHHRTFHLPDVSSLGRFIIERFIIADVSSPGRFITRTVHHRTVHHRTFHHPNVSPPHPPSPTLH